MGIPFQRAGLILTAAAFLLGGTASAQPVVTAVVNAVTNTTSLAPGTLATVFGTNLGNQTPANTTVMVAGQAAYVSFSSATQLNIELPVNATTGQVALTVTFNGATSAPFNITLNTFAPAIFNPAGNIALCNRQNNSTLSAANPATPGEVLACSAVGLGPTTPAVATGAPGPSNPPAQTNTTPFVSFGGQSVTPSFSGLAPGTIAVYQINFAVPASTATGNYALFIQIGGFTSNTVTVPVQGGLAFYPMTPCRIANTRGNGFSGNFGPPQMAAGSVRSFPVLTGGCNVPSTAKAYSLNVTAVPAVQLIYLSMWPTGSGQPTVSTLNDFSTLSTLTGNVQANAAIVPAGTGGSVNVYVSDATDVIIDINGYFAPLVTGGLAFYPLPPCRVADTRGNGYSGSFGPPTLGTGMTRTFPIQQSGCNVPATAQAYSLNMTVVPVNQLTYLTTWPAGAGQPTVSTLNDFSPQNLTLDLGRVVANAALVPASTSGAISVFASDATDLIIDINGYFAPPGGTGALSFYTAPPCRVADTRGNGLTGAFGPPSMGAGMTRSFPIPQSSCNIPAAAKAYSLNMTVAPPQQLIYLSTWPTGVGQPTVSTLNDFSNKTPTLGWVVANAALVPAGTNGAVSVYTNDLTDVIIDINGYFAP